jgi:predicted nucleic acid-binding protein
LQQPLYDSSFVAALIIPDEKNPRIDKIHSQAAEDETIFVPQLLWYEIGNVFNNLTRRKRYTYDEVLTFVPLLAAVRLTGDFETGAGYSEKLLRISHNYDISAYDAAYLELAGRKKAVLCTLDENLQTAAKKHGVVVLK